MVLDRVRADAYQNGIMFLDGFIIITEATSLGCSAAGEVLRIEVKHHVFLARPLRQAEGAIIIQGHCEVWCLIPYLEHFSLLMGPALQASPFLADGWALRRQLREGHSCHWGRLYDKSLWYQYFCDILKVEFFQTCLCL